MTNVKVSEMTQLLAADVAAADDYIPIIDASAIAALKNKRITVSDLATSTGATAAATAAAAAQSTADDAVADAATALAAAEAPVTPADIADSTWPRCRLRKSGNQAITPQGGVNTVTWDTEDYDTNSMHDNVTNNSRITINTAGTYLVVVYTHWASNPAGTRLTAIRKNGASKREAWNNCEAEADNLGRQTMTWIGRLAVNDYIEIEVVQSAGGSLNLLATDATQGDTFVAVELLP